MTIQIKVNPFGALRPYLEVVDLAFGEVFNELDRPSREAIYELDRLLCAMDGPRMVGGAAAFSFRLSVPGGEVPAAGVTAIGVLPTHRRRGILTALIARQFEEVHERGEPLAVLWASEGTIYQRFGYGLGTLSGRIAIDRHHAAFRDPAAPAGSVELLTVPEARSSLPPIYEAIRGGQPGFFARSEAWWESETFHDPEHSRAGYSPRFFGLFSATGSPEGYIVYRVKGDWDASGPKGVLAVVELMATTERAYRALWQYAFGVDLMERIEAHRLQSRPPLLLQVAEPSRLNLHVSDGLWVRLVDVEAALAARRYGVDGALVVEVADAACPWNSGRWLLQVDDGVARVTRTERPPDLVLDPADLGAIYLGGVHPSELARAGRGREGTAGALGRADLLFGGSREPWCAQLF